MKIGPRAAGGMAMAFCLSGIARAEPSPLQRTPVARERIVQLAYVLGEAHALHRLCAGPADATWYDRMQRLEAQEAGDEGFRRRMVDSFNAGFASREAEFPTCNRASEAVERRVAAQGLQIARDLADGE